MKTAVILFNLGGPSSLEGVKPFLFNLFYDPAIIRLPNPLRWILAKVISKRREKTATQIYKEIGGKSPILENTILQQKALQRGLDEKGVEAKVFVAMRYTSPRIEDVIEELAHYKPDKIVLLPLYPQYSTTTTASSFKEWDYFFSKSDIKASVHKVCCYPDATGFLKAQVDLMKIDDLSKFRVLFSAHGLPMSIVKSGDPYTNQVEITAAKIASYFENLDYKVCYQSRVGPVEWVGPSTEDEIVKCGKEGKNIVLVPLSFVSEHSETLFELDIEYKTLAKESGVLEYIRVPTVSTHYEFVNLLVDMTLKMVHNDSIICSYMGQRMCSDSCKSCPCSYKS